jgi:8-oxo-dGTP pyrophosphatase MutT (NUDIX family)
MCVLCVHEPIEPLVVAESASFSIASAPEPLAPAHLLLIPRSHLASLALLSEPQARERAVWQERLERFLTAEYGSAAFVEPPTMGPHALLHAAAAPHGELIEAVSRQPRVSGGYSPSAAALALAARTRLRWQRNRSLVSDEAIELVACVLRRAGRICLFLRSPLLESAANRWHVVTGYLPEGAEPLRHALLEVEQETGLGAGQLELVRAAEPILLQRPDDVRRWRVHAFLLDVLDGEPRLNWEHVDLRWIEPRDLGGLNTIPWLWLLLDGLLGSSWRSVGGDFKA